MKKVAFLFWLMLMCPLWSTPGQQAERVQAQHPLTKKSGTPLVRAEDRYSSTPFDPSVRVLSPGFRGHDPELIYAALKRARLIKDEFESTQEYNRRMDMVKNQIMLGSLTLQSLYAFDLELFNGYRLPTTPNYSGLPITPTYDADAGSMSISLDPSLLTGSNFQLYYFRSKSRVTPRGSYIGSNAFGVARTIRSYIYDSWCLAVPRPLENSALAVIFNIPPDRARAVRDRVRVLLVGRVVEPYTLPDEENGWGAEIAKPFEYIFKEHQMRFNPEYLVAYDPSTGEILGRESLSTSAPVIDPPEEPSSAAVVFDSQPEVLAAR
jgi:hypothetical protein